MPQPFPGTGEHLDLFCRRDVLNVACNFGSGISVPGVLTQDAVQTVQAGEWVTLRTLSPEGDFSTKPFGILGEVFATGATPVPVMPGIASSLSPVRLILITPGSGPGAARRSSRRFPPPASTSRLLAGGLRRHERPSADRRGRPLGAERALRDVARHRAPRHLTRAAEPRSTVTCGRRAPV